MASKSLSNRIERDKHTFERMLNIYCRAHHGNNHQLCTQCQRLLRYASIRLTKCPYGSIKPACGTCPLNCHDSKKRAQIREVMRFAGPRMLWRHPLLALRHLWNSHITTRNMGKKPSPR